MVKNKLTMEEKNRLNEIYAKGVQPYYQYVTISEKAIEHIEFLNFASERLEIDLDDDLADDVMIINEIIKIFDSILLNKYVELDLDLKEKYLKRYGMYNLFNEWKESRLTDKEEN